MRKLMFMLLLLLLTACDEIDEREIEIYFCPADNCQGQVLEELSSAEESIYFMIYSFSDNAIAQLLVGKSKIIEVQGVIEKQRITSKYNVFRYLNDSGVDVMPDKNRAIMHNKVFIIDEETVITGSYNPTANGNENNNENVVIIHDEKIAKMFMKEYRQISK